MPYINTVTTTKIDKNLKEELTKKLGEAITLIPGKTEEWLMLRFEDEAEMAFRGKCDGEYAMIEVALLGKTDKSALAPLTKRLTEIAEECLGVKGDGVYIKYFETDKWGYNGFNF